MRVSLPLARDRDVGFAAVELVAGVVAVAVAAAAVAVEVVEAADIAVDST